MGRDIEESQTFLIGQELKLMQAKLGLIPQCMGTSKECRKERKELCLEIKPIQVRFQSLEY